MNIEFKITTWAIASLYVAINALIYSWVFWDSFHINILQHASFSDAMPSILYTIALPCIFFAAAIIISHIWILLRPHISDYINNTLNFLFDNYEEKKQKFQLLKNMLKNLTVIFLTIFLAWDFSTNIYDKLEIKDFDKDFFLLYLATISVPLITFLIVRHTGFLKETRRHRSIIIFLLVATPFVCYFTASIQAKKIITGKDTYIINSDSQCVSGPNEKFRYIASFSDKAFAMSLRDGNICIFKYNYIKLIPEIKSTNSVPIPANKV